MVRYMKLHNYFRSSASYRVRIALNLKSVPYEYCSVHLSRGGGEQFTEEFNDKNPSKLVPVLEDGDVILSQSLAIIDYLDGLFPEPPLLPSSLIERSYVLELSSIIACDIHPLNNLRILRYLKENVGIDEKTRNDWVVHWTASGLAALEAKLRKLNISGTFALGDEPSLIDCCLIPQMFHATRFGVDLSPYPLLNKIDGYCNSLEAFKEAHPSRQPDSE